MFESSSDSSLDQGSLPSVINLYAPAATNTPDPQPPSNRYPTISYVDSVSNNPATATPNNLGVILENHLAVSPSRNIVFYPGTATGGSSLDRTGSNVDRVGSCGSPTRSTSSSSSSSDSTYCDDAERGGHNSTTSTSTNSSDEAADQLTGAVLPSTLPLPPQLAQTSINAATLYQIKPSQMLGSVSLSTEHPGGVILESPSGGVPHFVRGPGTTSPASIDSRRTTSSSSHSAKTVRISTVITNTTTSTNMSAGSSMMMSQPPLHRPIRPTSSTSSGSLGSGSGGSNNGGSRRPGLIIHNNHPYKMGFQQQYLQQQRPGGISSVPEAILGIQTGGGADSGISNTSPETLSSSEFFQQQRKILGSCGDPLITAGNPMQSASYPCSSKVSHSSSSGQFSGAGLGSSSGTGCHDSSTTSTGGGGGGGGGHSMSHNKLFSGGLIRAAGSGHGTMTDHHHRNILDNRYQGLSNTVPHHAGLLMSPYHHIHPHHIDNINNERGVPIDSVDGAGGIIGPFSLMKGRKTNSLGRIVRSSSGWTTRTRTRRFSGSNLKNKKNIPADNDQNFQDNVMMSRFGAGSAITGSDPCIHRHDEYNVEDDDDDGIHGGTGESHHHHHATGPNIQTMTHLDDSSRINSKLHTPYDLREHLATVSSILYCLTVIILGTLLPLVEIHDPLHFFNSHEPFYIYLHGGSIFFLACLYAYLAATSSSTNTSARHDKRSNALPLSSSLLLLQPPYSACNTPLTSHKSRCGTTGVGATPEYNVESISDTMDPTTNTVHSSLTPPLTIQQHTYQVRRNSSDLAQDSLGALLLRLVVLGMGLITMIRDGLMFGRVLDSGTSHKSSSHNKYPLQNLCANSSLAVRHVFSLIGTFLQLYFVFVNSKIHAPRLRGVIRLGLLHLVATNVCAMLKVVIKDAIFETAPGPSVIITKQLSHAIKHDTGEVSIVTLDPTRHILQQEGLYKPKNKEISTTPSLILSSSSSIIKYIISSQSSKMNHLPINTTNFFCEGGDLTLGIVRTAEPYLFPFAVQFYLFSTVLLLLMSAISRPTVFHHHHHHRSSKSSRPVVISPSGSSHLLSSLISGAPSIPDNLRAILSNGRRRRHHRLHPFSSPPGTVPTSSDPDPSRTLTPAPPFFATRGLFGGLGCIVISVVTLIITHILNQKQSLKSLALSIHVSLEIITLLILLICSIIILLKMPSFLYQKQRHSSSKRHHHTNHHHHHHHHNDTVQWCWEILVFVAMTIGIFLRAIVDLVTGFMYPAAPNRTIIIVRSFVVILQASLQAMLLGGPGNRHGQHRGTHKSSHDRNNHLHSNVYSPTHQRRQRTTGRQLLALIALGNIALWCYPAFRIVSWQPLANGNQQNQITKEVFSSSSEPYQNIIFGRSLSLLLFRTSVSMEILYRLLVSLMLTQTWRLFFS